MHFSFLRKPHLIIPIAGLVLAGTVAGDPPNQPAWWSEGDPPVIVPGAPQNNKGPANIGQAKYMAKRALESLAAVAPDLAADVQSDLVGPGKPIPTFDVPANPDAAWLQSQKAPLLIGQLKAISAPFYDHLHTAAPDWLLAQRQTNGTHSANTHYPWTADAADDQNKAIATIGQLKAVFSLRFEGLQVPVFDADGDGLPDDWEIANGLDPRDITGDNGASGDPDHDGLSNYEEYQQDTDPLADDTDGDGITDGGELDQGTDPLDSSSRPSAEWVTLSGDLAKGVTKTKSRTVKIPAGQTRIVVVAVGSEEYPLYTSGVGLDFEGNPYQFNDTLSWNVIPSAGGSPISGSLDVNSRHQQWIQAENAGTSVLGLSPAHIERTEVYTAPPESDITVNVSLAATNIHDGLLPSTVMVGLLPVEVVEVSPKTRDEENNEIAGSELPSTGRPLTPFVELNPVADRIAHRELKVKIGQVLKGKTVTWTLDAVPNAIPAAIRGRWNHSTTHPDRFEVSAAYGANGFTRLSQESGRTTVADDGFTAIRVNVPPVGFNQVRIRIQIEGVDTPIDLIDMEVPGVVVIDPGHGGTADEPGSSWNNATSPSGALEKTMALNYGLALRDALRAIRDTDRLNLRIFMTRETDINRAGSFRAAKARDNGADIINIIHFNASDAHTARGTLEVYRTTSNVFPQQDTILSEGIITRMVAAMTPFDAGANHRARVIYEAAVASDQNNGNTAAYCPVRTSYIEVEFIDFGAQTTDRGNDAVDILLNTGPNAAAVKTAIANAMRDGILHDLRNHQPQP